jgi:hypothetical protein
VLSTGVDRRNVLYSRLFYFARLRPRVLFAIGAGLRALQMTTSVAIVRRNATQKGLPEDFFRAGARRPVQHVFDPSAGSGAGLNLLALFAGARWSVRGRAADIAATPGPNNDRPAPIVLGWGCTKRGW